MAVRRLGPEPGGPFRSGSDSGSHPEHARQVLDCVAAGRGGSGLLLQVANDLEEALADERARYSILRPAIAGAGLETRLKRKAPDAIDQAWHRVFVDFRRWDQEDRIAKGHRLTIEVPEEIPEVRIVDEAAGRKGERDLEDPALSMDPEAPGSLDLQRCRDEALPAVGLDVTVVIVGGWIRGLDLAVARDRHELYGFGLADDAALSRRQWHQSPPKRHSKMAWTELPLD